MIQHLEILIVFISKYIYIYIYIYISTITVSRQINISIPQKINFVGKLEGGDGETMFFITEK